MQKIGISIHLVILFILFASISNTNAQEIETVAIKPLAIDSRGDRG